MKPRPPAFGAGEGTEEVDGDGSVMEDGVCKGRAHGRISHAEPPPLRFSPHLLPDPRLAALCGRRRDPARGGEPGRLRAAPLAGAVLPPERPSRGRGLEPGRG